MFVNATPTGEEKVIYVGKEGTPLPLIAVSEETAKHFNDLAMLLAMKNKITFKILKFTVPEDVTLTLPSTWKNIMGAGIEMGADILMKREPNPADSNGQPEK